MTPASRTFIKICGITRLGDARAAVSSGANAVGFIFARSLRRVSANEAAAITKHLHPAVNRIGVFVDASLERIGQVVDRVGLDGVQLQGSESPQFVASLKELMPGLTVFKVIRPHSAQDVADAVAFEADAIFLDPRDPANPFGAVAPIPLSWMEGIAPARFVVAGGLKPENVGELVTTLRPWGVDVSGGVESRPGKKDGAKIRSFVRAVREAEAPRP